MARALRVEYPGALYHVISRGNAKQNIFLTDRDRLKFLDWLSDMLKTHNIICHAYCLMNNHYHLLLETPDGNLSRGMRDLNGNYTQWFNAVHKRVGHLFQGRYKAFIIEKETYLLEVARYIVINPVRAGLVSRAAKWKWSSYAATAGIEDAPKWLTTSGILGMFSKRKAQAEREYAKFVRNDVGQRNPYDEIKNGFLLGSPQFIHEIWKKTNGSEAVKEYPRNERVVGRPSLEELFRDVKSKSERNEAIQIARIRCGYLASEIARYIGLDSAVVGRISRGVYNRKTNRENGQKVGSRT